MAHARSFTILLALALLATAAPGPAPAAPGDHVWSRGFDAETLADITPDGEVTVAGMFDGTVDFGGGPLTSSNPFGDDMYVARFDANGNHVFSFAVAAGQGHGVNAVRADHAGGTYVMGRIYSGTVDFGGGPLAANNDFYVVRYDQDGNHLFSGLHGDAEVYDADADAQGLMIVGATRSTADFGGGPLTTAGDTDALIARLDGAGNHVFSAIYGDPYGQYARAVGLDAAGGSVVAFQIAGTIDFGGGPLVPAGFGLALVEFDDAGAHVRSELFDGDFTSGITYNVHLDVKDDGGFVVAGELHGAADLGGGPLYTANKTDVYVALFATDGTHLFSASYGSTSYQVVNSVTFAPDDAIVLSGNFVNDLDFGGGVLSAGPTTPKLFLARLDAGGAHEFSTTYEGPSGAYSLVTRTNAAGAVLLAASSSPDLDLGGGPLGPYYNFLGVLEGSGTVPSSVTDGGTPAAPVSVAAYPNPFNPATKLAFTLDHRGEVEVLVHDLRGALVARLYRGELDAGAHELEWRAEGVPSGVYLATVRAGAARRTTPVTLVK
ncbi:MAG: hypothetical protein ABR506_04770, partial [Candidatus Krumholzibacteriia bacterium]